MIEPVFNRDPHSFMEVLSLRNTLHILKRYLEISKYNSKIVSNMLASLPDDSAKILKRLIKLEKISLPIMSQEIRRNNRNAEARLIEEKTLSILLIAYDSMPEEEKKSLQSKKKKTSNFIFQKKIASKIKYIEENLRINARLKIELKKTFTSEIIHEVLNNIKFHITDKDFPNIYRDCRLLSLIHQEREHLYKTGCDKMLIDLLLSLSLPAFSLEELKQVFPIICRNIITLSKMRSELENLHGKFLVKNTIKNSEAFLDLFRLFLEIKKNTKSASSIQTYIKQHGIQKEEYEEGSYENFSLFLFSKMLEKKKIIDPSFFQIPKIFSFLKGENEVDEAFVQSICHFFEIHASSASSPHEKALMELFQTESPLSAFNVKEAKKHILFIPDPLVQKEWYMKLSKKNHSLPDESFKKVLRELYLEIASQYTRKIEHSILERYADFFLAYQEAFELSYKERWCKNLPIDPINEDQEEFMHNVFFMQRNTPLGHKNAIVFKIGERLAIKETCNYKLSLIAKLPGAIPASKLTTIPLVRLKIDEEVENIHRKVKIYSKKRTLKNVKGMAQAFQNNCESNDLKGPFSRNKQSRIAFESRIDERGFWHAGILSLLIAHGDLKFISFKDSNILFRKMQKTCPITKQKMLQTIIIDTEYSMPESNEESDFFPEVLPYRCGLLALDISDKPCSIQLSPEIFSLVSEWNETHFLCLLRDQKIHVKTPKKDHGIQKFFSEKQIAAFIERFWKIKEFIQRKNELKQAFTFRELVHHTFPSYGILDELMKKHNFSQSMRAEQIGFIAKKDLRI